MDKLNQLVRFSQANCLLRFGQSPAHRDFFKAVVEILPHDLGAIYKQTAGGMWQEDEVIDFLYEGVRSVVDVLIDCFSNDKTMVNFTRYGFPVNANISFAIDRQGVVFPLIDFNSYEHIQDEDLVEIGKTAVWRELLGVDVRKYLRKCASCNRLFLASHGKKETCSASCAKKSNYSKAKEKPGYSLRKRLENQKYYLEKVRSKAWIKKRLQADLTEKWRNEGVPEDMIKSILYPKRGRKPKTPRRPLPSRSSSVR